MASWCLNGKCGKRLVINKTRYNATYFEWTASKTFVGNTKKIDFVQWGVAPNILAFLTNGKKIHLYEYDANNLTFLKTLEGQGAEYELDGLLNDEPIWTSWRGYYAGSETITGEDGVFLTDYYNIFFEAKSIESWNNNDEWGFYQYTEKVSNVGQLERKPAVDLKIFNNKEMYMAVRNGSGAGFSDKYTIYHFNDKRFLDQGWETWTVKVDDRAVGCSFINEDEVYVVYDDNRYERINFKTGNQTGDGKIYSGLAYPSIEKFVRDSDGLCILSVKNNNEIHIWSDGFGDLLSEHDINVGSSSLDKPLSILKDPRVLRYNIN